jgi:4-amino-4-deoxy-L-arabinose transferase-like glycosyltransferase
LGYYYTYKLFRQKKYNLAVALLVILGFVFRLYLSTDLFLHEWDERFHALVAKNMMQNPFKPMLYANPILPYDYQSWTNSHIWLHKQPIPLWTMALSFKMFGVNEISLRIPSILLSSIGILLMYKVGEYYYNKSVGFISAFFFSIHGLIIELSAGKVATDHIDVFFLFFVLLSVYFGIKLVQTKKHLFTVLFGISVGLGILSKWLPALIVFPVITLLMLHSKNFSFKEIILHNLIALTVSIIVFMPWQIYIHTTFPLEAKFESDFNFKHITEALENHSGGVFYHFDKLRILYGEIVYLPILWFLIKYIKNYVDFKKLSLLIWFLVPFLFFSFVKTKMQAYTLFASPSIFIICSLFVVYLQHIKTVVKYKWIFNLAIIALVFLPIRYSFERIKPLETKPRTIAWAEEIKALKKLKGDKDLVIFNIDRPIDAMFYIDNCVAYSYIPEEYEINRIKAAGYDVIIFENNSVINNKTQKSIWSK